MNMDVEVLVRIIMSVCVLSDDNDVIGVYSPPCLCVHMPLAWTLAWEKGCHSTITTFSLS